MSCTTGLASGVKFDVLSQITTITFFRYQGLERLWAFGMMQFAHRYLAAVKGLGFYKLLGTGKGNGFNPWPDYSRYALLQVWDNEQDAELFFQSHRLYKKYRHHSEEQWTLFMKTIKADGLWSGENPFEVDPSAEPKGSVAIITRATIRTTRLRTFWNYVPTSERPLETAEGLIYTKGIGEVPFLQMATFSLWENEEAVKSFAYRSREHSRAIKLTRALDWYKEELFARFKPYRSLGTWYGVDPLASKNRLQ